MAVAALASMLWTHHAMSAEAETVQPIVVELFTSESCGMCPPADAFLVDLDQDPGVLALSYHVTLWNFLGWPDPLSLPQNTRRQNIYNRRLRGRAPFTPQMVIEGAVSEPGGNRKRIRKTIERLREQREGQLPVRMALIHGDGTKGDGTKGNGKAHDHMVKISVGAVATTLANDGGENGGQVLLIAFRSHQDVTVRGGTNNGRLTTYVNAVYAIEPVAPWSGDPLTVSAPVPMDGDHMPDGIAVLVQSDLQGPIIGAQTITVAGHTDR